MLKQPFANHTTIEIDQYLTPAIYTIEKVVPIVIRKFNNPHLTLVSKQPFPPLTIWSPRPTKTRHIQVLPPHSNFQTTPSLQALFPSTHTRKTPKAHPISGRKSKSTNRPNKYPVHRPKRSAGPALWAKSFGARTDVDPEASKQ